MPDGFRSSFRASAPAGAVPACESAQNAAAEMYTAGITKRGPRLLPLSGRTRAGRRLPTYLGA